MKENPSVLIVEDELITATSIEELLTDEDYAITGIAKDAVTALRICSQTADPPDVVICDINIKGSVNGVQLAEQIRSLYGSEIIFLTAYSDSKTVQAASATDPVMYVVKPYSDVQLLVALQLAFFRIYSRQNKKSNSTLDLTKREVEITQLIAQGLSSKQVARKLLISIETVKTHRRRILQKNKISNFQHLIYLMNNSV